MNIGIDLDDCIVNFIDKYVAICNRLFGKPELDAQPIDWEWSNFGLTKEQHSQVWEKVKNTYNFWTDLPQANGVDFSRLYWLSKQHELFFITARVATKGASVRFQSAWWLNQHSLWCPTVIVSYDKGPLAAALKLDYFIDDRPKNCLEIKKSAPTCKVYVKNSSHNQTFSQPDIIRVQNMNEFMDIVTEDDRERNRKSQVPSVR